MSRALLCVSCLIALVMWTGNGNGAIFHIPLAPLSAYPSASDARSLSTLRISYPNQSPITYYKAVHLVVVIILLTPN